MAPPDRLQALGAQHAVTGLDFVYVDATQVTLDVYFLTEPGSVVPNLVNNVTLDQLTVYEAADPTRHPAMSLLPGITWPVVEGRQVLRVTVAQPGGYSLYRLRLDDGRIDRYFNDILFSFKANCPSDLDCAPEAPVCPPEPAVDFPVDYTARDFWSFRQALLDFAALRYPDWPDRLEADAGIMLAEVLSALGDEMAYTQDRIGREAYLETATQRRSLRRHARLVDYTVHDGLTGTTWLDFNIAAGPVRDIPAGSAVWALADTGERVVYEVGRGLAETLAQPPKAYSADPARNSLAPHIFDEHDACLEVGATEIFVNGHQVAHLPLDDPWPGPRLGRWVLLRTDPTNPAVAARRWPVRLVEVEELDDPLINDPNTGTAVTRLRWEAAQALPFEMDLGALQVRGNLAPASAGLRSVFRFAIGPSDDPTDHPEAVERTGANGSVAYLYSLPGSDQLALAWIGSDPRGAQPEVHLDEVRLVAGAWAPGDPWTWRRSLLGADSSQPTDRQYTLDDGAWRRVVGFQRPGQEIVHVDYASDAGFTIRFGDDEFGMVPAVGTIFQVTYRLGGGRVGNLPADSLTNAIAALNFVEAVSNPLPIGNGLDPETPEEVRQQAPDAFRYLTFRAVRPEDYAEAAERLDWVQRAGAVFRWTGSWLSAFVTPDPLGAEFLSEERRAALEAQLDRFRQAGRETYVLDPVYADIDLVINVCVEPFAYPGEVEKRVLAALLGGSAALRRPAFFSPDNFTFGTPLERSALEATIQSLPGVRGVEEMQIRRRGWFDWRPFAELVYTPGANEVIRLANDPRFPGRGTLRLQMEGGA
jgi:Baseplate J-like protein